MASHANDDDTNAEAMSVVSREMLKRPQRAQLKFLHHLLFNTVAAMMLVDGKANTHNVVRDLADAVAAHRGVKEHG